MPVVFSPGEPETRPLDPTATVYTTAQKVADLLDIGPSEAILVSANSVSDGVFITGGDFRNDGFSVGDTILIYSDADPLGVEKVITAISSSASGVKLAFTGGFTHADYQLADNAYVQNQASFTNGRTRGLTKDKVDKIQDELQFEPRYFPSDSLEERLNNIETRATLFEADLLKSADQRPIDNEQYMLLEFLSGQFETMEKEIQFIESNNINITFLKDQVEEMQNNIELLKDKVRNNGSN